MVKLKIGLSMLYCLGEPFEKMIKQISNNGVSHIEIVDEGFHTLNKQRVSALKNLGESFGLKYSVHAPFADINIASASKPILNAMLKRLEKSIGHASSLDAFLWVFHPGLRTGISMFYPRMDWLKNCETVQYLFKIASDYGVKIGIENVPEPYPFLLKSVQDFSKFYSEVDADMGLVLDVGHSNINGQTELFLRTFSQKIVHIHAHDNNGEKDQHLGIGYGTVDWKNFAKTLQEISYDRVIAVESVEHVRESVYKLKEFFK